MKVTFNKAAHYMKVSSLEEAAKIYRQFLNTYMALENDKRITNKVEFYGDMVNISAPITHEGSKVFDLKKIWGACGPDLHRKLLTILSSFASTSRTPTPNQEYTLDGISFLIPTDEHNSMLISLATRTKYENPILEGMMGEGKALAIKNIATPEHLKEDEHRIALGIRLYECNPKHKPTYTSMGNGELASPMDLFEAEAQALLNEAVSIDEGAKVLYAATNGKCYAFREHEPGKAVYHGYLVENPPEKVKRFFKLK